MVDLLGYIKRPTYGVMSLEVSLKIVCEWESAGLCYDKLLLSLVPSDRNVSKLLYVSIFSEC